MLQWTMNEPVLSIKSRSNHYTHRHSENVNMNTLRLHDINNCTHINVLSLHTSRSRSHQHKHAAIVCTFIWQQHFLTMNGRHFNNIWNLKDMLYICMSSLTVCRHSLLFTQQKEHGETPKNIEYGILRSIEIAHVWFIQPNAIHYINTTSSFSRQTKWSSI